MAMNAAAPKVVSPAVLMLLVGCGFAEALPPIFGDKFFLGYQQANRPEEWPVQVPVQHPVQHPVQQPFQHPFQHPVQYPVQVPVQVPVQYPTPSGFQHGGFAPSSPAAAVAVTPITTTSAPPPLPTQTLPPNRVPEDPAAVLGPTAVFGPSAKGAASGSSSGEAPVLPYSFQYAVSDAPSGNNFYAQESSDDGVTSGSYRVHLPDGRIQTVTYSVDASSGFKADVSYEGEAQYPPAPEPSPLHHPLQARGSSPAVVVGAGPLNSFASSGLPTYTTN